MSVMSWIHAFEVMLFRIYHQSINRIGMTSQTLSRRRAIAASGRRSVARIFFQRRDPEIDGVLERIFTGEHGDNLIRLDLVHCEVVRDDPGAGLELLKLRDKLDVQPRKQKQSNDVCFA